MTFREWLEKQSEGWFRSEDSRNTLMEALEEFDRRFVIATIEDLAMSTGTIWIEEEPGDE